MPLPFLPYQRDPIAGNQTTPNGWYRFFSDLRDFIASSGLDTGSIDAILARLDELETNGFGQFLIAGLASVQVFGTPQAGTVTIQLLGDTPTPPASYQYGTDVLGVRGWQRATDLTVYLTDESGNYLTDESGNLLTDGPNDNHNALNNRQGGSAFESYHTTQAENAAIVTAVANGGFVDVASNQTITGSKNFANVQTFSNGDVRLEATTDVVGTGPSLVWRRQRTGPSGVQSGDRLGNFLAAGLDSTGVFRNSAAIIVDAMDTYTATAFGSRITFQATPTGSATRTSYLFINQNGSVTPGSNNTQELGSTSVRWLNSYSQNYVLGSAAASFGGGSGVLFLSNATTAPTSAITGGMVPFAQSGSLKGMFPDGRVQTIAATGSKIITVHTLSDLPAPSGGVITLADNTSYYITTAIDVGANRIQCGLNNSLHGDDADNCSLTATGLSAATAFITSTSSLSLMSITIKDVGTALSLNDSTNQLNWRAVRFQNVPTMGTIQNYANIVWGQCILDNSANLTIQGTIGSLAFFECLFDGRTGQTTLTVPSTAVITRRIRMLYCAAIVQAGETGFNVSTSATIPDEGYVLDNVAFSGGGTYLAGLDYTSNKALFFNSSGIINSSALCQYSMTGNATATTIGATGTFVKIAGTTTASSLNQKFSTGTTQRATYTGAFTTNFRIVAFASMTSGNNQTLRMRVAKNGTTLGESNTLFKTTGSGEASAVGCQVIVSLAPTDYVELWVANDTAATNITVSDLNFTITRLN